MKQDFSLLKASLWAVLGCVAAVYLAGCEDNAEEEDFHNANVTSLVVQPASTTLRDGTYVVFTATGGTMPYNWSVSDSSLGTVTNTQGSIVTYRRNGAANGVNQVIVVDQNGWSSFGTVSQMAVVSNAAATNATSTATTNSTTAATTNSP